jgi:hypothetical protein
VQLPPFSRYFNPLGPNIPLSTLFTNTLTLCSSPNVTDQVSQPYKTNDRIMVLDILTFRFPDNRREDRRLWTQWQQAFPVFILLLISSCMQFRSVNVVPSYLNIATISKDLFAIFMLRFCPTFWLRDTNTYLVFCGFTSRPTSLLASNRDFVFYRVYILFHYVKVICTGQKLMCPIQFQLFLVRLDTPNGAKWQTADLKSCCGVKMNYYYYY